MSDMQKLARFLVSPSPEGSDPNITIELEDGFTLTLTASFSQIEDMADALDGILDATPSGDEKASERVPAFLQRTLSQD